MRDYSFGNFISALRQKCGLSQYQLGALVGVSDKAVSKWENGVSKPRMGTIVKLSEVLNVSVDELLTCEYTSFDKERKDLFAMKNEIITIARNRLEELYGDSVPIGILNRFHTEKMMLDGQNALLWMGFFGRLKRRFSLEDAYFEVRNPQLGASFIAWLLGGTALNPLPAHYYCPNCKHIEFVFDAKCGMDLPEKKCSCGEDYHKDGFGVDVVNMYPLSNAYEIYVSKNGTKLAREVMCECFNGYGEVQEFGISQDGMGVMVTHFGVFPDKINQDLSYGEYRKFYKDIHELTILEDQQKCLQIQEMGSVKFTRKQISDYYNYLMREKVIRFDARKRSLEKISAKLKNPQFSDLLIIYGFLHSTGAWEENAEYLFDEGIPFDELISCREDVYSFLREKMNQKFGDNFSGQAFEIKEKLRMGKYAFRGMPTETEALLLECDVPKWYVESMKKIMYLMPKTHLVQRLKRDICEFLDSAWYE